MHVAVAALKAEFSWPSLSFVVRHSKKCLTHLELLRELDEGGALTTTSSKQKMYSRSVFYAYNFFFALMERPCGDLIPQKIYKNGHKSR